MSSSDDTSDPPPWSSTSHPMRPGDVVTWENEFGEPIKLRIQFADGAEITTVLAPGGVLTMRVGVTSATARIENVDAKPGAAPTPKITVIKGGLDELA